MHRLFGTHMVMYAAENMTSTFVESNSEVTDHNPPPKSEFILKSLFNTRSEMEW